MQVAVVSSHGDDDDTNEDELNEDIFTHVGSFWIEQAVVSWLIVVPAGHTLFAHFLLSLQVDYVAWVCNCRSGGAQ